MALFQPSNITPSVLAGVGQGVVDVADELSVTWQINGNSPLNAFVVSIYENNATSDYVSSSRYQPVSPAAYGTDEKGNITPYTFDNDGLWGADYDLVNGKSYKLKIMQFGGSKTVKRYTTSTIMAMGSTYAFAIDGIFYSYTAPANLASGATMDIHSGNLLVFNAGSLALGSIVYTAYATVSTTYDGTSVLIPGSSSTATVYEVVMQNAETVFITRAMPTLAFYPPSTLAVVSRTFTATYSQAQGDAIKWARWQLALKNGTTRTIIDDTGEITTSVLSYTYDSFLNGNVYSIMLTVESENGQRVTTGWEDITVSYNVSPAATGIDGECNDADGSILLSWQGASVIPGTGSLGEGVGYSMADSKITIDNALVYISWGTVDGEAMSFSTPYTAAWRGELIGRFTQNTKTTFHSNNTQAAAFNSNGTMLLVSGYNSTDVYTSTAGGGLTYERTVAKGSKYVTFNNSRTVAIIGKSIYSISGTVFTYVADIPNGSDDAPSAFSPDDKYLFHGRYIHRISTTTISSSLEITQAPATVTSIVVYPTTYSREVLINGSLFTYYQQSESTLQAPFYIGSLNIGGNDVEPTWLSMSGDGQKIAGIVGGTPVLFTNNQLTPVVTFDAYFDQSITDAQRIAIGGGNTPKYVAVSTLAHGVRIYDITTKQLITALKYNNMEVPEGSELLAFDPDGTKLISGYFTYMAIEYMIPSSTATLIQLSDVYGLVLNSTVLSFTSNGVSTTIDTVPPGTNNGIVAVTDTEVKCYYYFNSQFNSMVTKSVSLNLPTITSVKARGAQVCDWIYITPDTDYDFRAIDKPSYNGAAYFFADFNGTLDAGSTDDANTTYNTVYRVDTETGILTKLCKLPKAYSTFKDYGVRSLTTNTYRLYYLSSSGYYSSAAESDEICKRLTSYYLMETTEDEDVANVFHVKKVWRFGNNYSGGGVPNGNAPEFLANFTRYPLRQGSVMAAKSGSLTALLSNFTANGYEDTAAEMDALYDLSLSHNHIFLKDTKGNLYEVHTSAPITMTIDTTSRVQEVAVTIPWQEVADASNAVLIQTPLDAEWSV